VFQRAVDLSAPTAVRVECSGGKGNGNSGKGNGVIVLLPLAAGGLLIDRARRLGVERRAR
jgi:hypothetical protein